MDTTELAQSPTPVRGRRSRLTTAALLVTTLAAGSGVFVYYSLCSTPETPQPKVEPVGAGWDYEKVFPNWPKDKKPDFVIALTGQTYAYLQKCGCSDPQLGGLERRWNFFEGFKAHGIEVIPLDLGDVAPHEAADNKLIQSQGELKYTTAMRVMKALGYRAVGLGKEEFHLGLLNAIGAYSLQQGNEDPPILAANLVNIGGVGKEMLPNGKQEPAIRDWEVVPAKNNVTLGIVAIMGDPVVQGVKKIDNSASFAEPPKSNSAKVIQEALAAMAKAKSRPNLNVLLYNGPFEILKDKDGQPLKQPIPLAEAAAKAFPDFQVIVCNTEESDPAPNFPVMFPQPNGKNTLIIRVGHKGQNIGVVGVFADGKGGYELKYQRVAMSPEFETPPGMEAKNLALTELENYSKTVKARDFLTKNRKVMHPLQAANPQAEYAGSQSCLACHNGPVHNGVDNSWNVYVNSKHNQAYNALVNIAKKPSLRQFDGECIRCHTVGYDYKTGFVDDATTPLLKNVGCESCHGPGSLHNKNPNNKALALALSPWKVNGEGKLPDLARLKAYAEESDPFKKQKLMTPAEVQVMLRVDRVCQSCHNVENDPHFKFENFWPKIAHGVQPKNPANPAPMANNNPPPAPPGPALPLPLPQN